MNFYDIVLNSIPPKSALGLQSRLLTLPINKILKTFTPEFEANLQRHPGFIYLWRADDQSYGPTLRENVYEKRNCP